jgi:hypothetical protein
LDTKDTADFYKIFYIGITHTENIILGIGGTIGAIIIGIIALIIIIAIIVFLIELLAPLFIGIIILAIIVVVGWWIYSKIKSR